MSITKLHFPLVAKLFLRIFKRYVKNAISGKVMRNFITQLSNKPLHPILGSGALRRPSAG